MRRRIAFVAVICGLVGCATAAADGPTLGGRIEVAGAAPAYAPVVLDRALTLDLADDTNRPAAKVSGKAPFKGFILRHDGPRADEPGLAALSLFGFENFAFVDPIGTAHNEADEEPNHYYARLPAGQYRVYLLTDGTPVTGVLTLPGLDGSVAVSPIVPTDMKLVETPRLDDGPLTNNAVFGASAVLTTPGMVYTEVDVDSDAEAANRLELCIYGPADDHSGADAFTRGCPGATEGPGDPSYVADPDILPGALGYGAGWARFSAAAGSFGLGGNVLSAGVPPTVSAISAWLSYGPPSPPPPPAPPAVATHAPKKKAAKHRKARRCRHAKRHKSAHKSARSTRKKRCARRRHR